MNKVEIKNYIDSLKGYQGYIQYSNRPISKDEDIFIDINPKVKYEDGFIYEAHFCNEKESISIKQINDSWIVSKTDISSIEQEDIITYLSDIKDFNYKIKMAQIWQSEPDELCEGMKVMKLKKVVFAGFEKEKKQ